MRRFTIDTEELSGSQLLVLSELLGGATVSSAARAGEVHRATVHRWLRNDPSFIAAWNEGRAEQFEAARQKVLMLTTRATEVVQAALDTNDVTSALAILKATGILSPPRLGPTDAQSVARELDEEMAGLEADDYLRGLLSVSLHAREGDQR